VAIVHVVTISSKAILVKDTDYLDMIQILFTYREIGIWARSSAMSRVGELRITSEQARATTLESASVH
jgi:hypothetical protein